MFTTRDARSTPDLRGSLLLVFRRLVPALCFCLCLSLLSVPATVRAETGTEITASSETTSAQDPTIPRFDLIQANGTRVRGIPDQFDQDGALTFLPDSDALEPIVIAQADLWRLERVRARVNYPPMARTSSPTFGDRNDDRVNLVLLTGSRRLHAQIESADDDGFVVRSKILDQVTIPFDQVAGLVLRNASEDGRDDEVRLLDRIAEVRSVPNRSAVVWLSNGDRVRGAFLGLNPSRLRIRQDNGNQAELGRSRFLAVGFDPRLLDRRVPESPHFELTLNDGSRVIAESLRFRDGEFDVALRLGLESRIAPSAVVAIEQHGGRVRSLLDREPVATRYEPYLGPEQPHQINRAVDGSPMRLLGRTYERGIGMSSRTVLAYPLQSDEERFLVRVGLDDRAGALGGAICRVRLDSTVVWESDGPIVVGAEPIDVDVPLGNATYLLLETDYGTRGNVRDHVDWVDPRLVRKAE